MKDQKIGLTVWIILGVCVLPILYILIFVLQVHKDIIRPLQNREYIQAYNTQEECETAENTMCYSVPTEQGMEYFIPTLK